MTSEFTQLLLDEAEQQMSKEANGPNGEPSQQPVDGVQEDAVSLAQSFIANVDAFKQSLNQQAGGAEGVEQVTPGVEGQEQVVDAGQVAPQATETGVTIQTPSGSIVKVAALALMLGAINEDSEA